MTLKEFFSKFKSPILWGNFIAMAVVVALLIFGTFKVLDQYTRHGEKIGVPNVKGKLLADATYLIESRGLEVVVIDSGYIRSLPPGCILEQIPAEGDTVKSGHIIYLTVNARNTPTIPLPDIADNSSQREAEARLKAMGFKMMPCEYVEGEKDWVYGVKCQGRNVVAGQRVPVDAPLALQVGNGRAAWDDDSTSYVNFYSSYPNTYESEETIDEGVGTGTGEGSGTNEPVNTPEQTEIEY